MSESLQLSIDLATSLSIIFAAGAFIYQQWKESYEKKELGLWQEIREVIDTQADTMLEATKIKIQYNTETIQAEQENLDYAVRTGFTEFLNIIQTVKFRVRLDTKKKIEALLIRQETYEAKKKKLDEIFIRFDRECNGLIYQVEIMKRGALNLANKEGALNLANNIKIAEVGLIGAILGDAFYKPGEKAESDAEIAAQGNDFEIGSLNTLFDNFSYDLFDLAYDK